MVYDSSNFSKHFQGFKSTKPLWRDRRFCDIEQFQCTSSNNGFDRDIDRRLRLGQLAEQFVFHELETLTDCNILVENFQVLDGKRTLGELDCIVEYLNEIYHLELVYKFYLYDETLGNKEIERWIGPNRSDSLLEKMNKLKQKQFPLLFNEITRSQLSERNINILDIHQSVIFKAQLFLPFRVHAEFEALNKECVSGYYLHVHQLDRFKRSQFFIPEKLDWFLEPHLEVDWQDESAFLKELGLFLSRKRSPMVWIKNEEERVEKYFVVWW